MERAVRIGNYLIEHARGGVLEMTQDHQLAEASCVRSDPRPPGRQLSSEA